MDWSKLNRQQLGTYAEYYFKMEFTMHGISVFTAEVDDRGIDFVARVKKDGHVKHYDVQVKSIRSNSTYIFIPESKFIMSDTYLVAVAIFNEQEGKPNLYLIPANAWLKPNALFNYKDYQSRGLKSKNEYGINLSKKNMTLLQTYALEKCIVKI